METIANFDIPPKIKHVLFSNSRYKVLYGGRGGAKSHSIAQYAIIRALQSPTRILCAREYQNSISDSVYKLLVDYIRRLNLTDYFEITQSSIKSFNGSEFMFKGIARDIDAIRSTEGIDVLWVEEAEKVSANSWDIIIPTIRKENSQIIISYNPDDENNNTHQRFVVNPPDDCSSALINYYDNPFFPEVLRREMEYCKRIDFDKYKNIWLGNPKGYSDAIIFKNKYAVEDFNPYDKKTDGRLYLGADWGFSDDPTALVRCFIRNQRLYIDYEAYGHGVELEQIASLFDRIPEARNHLIVADCARPETVSYVKRQHFHIESCEKWKGCVEDRIAYLKSFEKIIIHPRCLNTIEEFGSYRYKQDKNTGKILPEIVKASDHIIDALGYALNDYIKKNISILDLM